MPAEQSNTVLDSSKHELSACWNLNNLELTPIKLSENHTFVANSDGNKFILRCSPLDHRTKSAIQAELDFILLTSNFNLDLHLCKPILNRSQEYILQLKLYDDKAWYAVLFEYAQGTDPTQQWSGLTDTNVFEAYGRTLAMLHQASMHKSGDVNKWNQIKDNIPILDQLHGGASGIERIQSRAELGHVPSKMLLNLWHLKIAPFVKSCGQSSDSTFGIIHGDLNISNYFTKRADDKTDLWVFDFDQVHQNWFGYDIGVVLHMIQFFEENSSNMKIENFDAKSIRSAFLSGYAKNFTPMVDEGHLEPSMLNGFELLREYSHTAIAVDILFQVSVGKKFEESIVSFCKLCSERFENKYASN
ncbi:hypothetical protein AKO1_005448 [Acrasis kona]|uniref:Aminoglycoside phosphotransferase domain-containing protein n=1 Tax=Acrasis kona TaxID=1008807 RepID=A0AAW2YIU8_9EUKA